MLYFDNASTTRFKPQCVIDGVNDAIANSCNANRTAQGCWFSEQLYQTRKLLSLLYNNDGENHVAFTGGCTEALNLAIIGTARRGHIVISCAEHNSVIRPVYQLASKGYASVSVVYPDQTGQITAENLNKVITKDTTLVCISHTSNVTGVRQNYNEIAYLCHKNGALLLADCAQSVGYTPLDMQQKGVDMVAIGSHKGLHGIMGAGALIFHQRCAPRPIRYGGTGTDSHLVTQPTTLPESLESGTLPMPAIVSMQQGIKWYAQNHRQNATILKQLQSLLIEGLSQIKGVSLFSKPNDSGIVTLSVNGLDSVAVADTLATTYNIAVRGGLHCAPLIHQHLGTQTTGLVRISVGVDNTKQQCLALIKALQEICKNSLLL